MSSKILTLGAIAPTQITITNKVSAAALAAFRPDDGTVIQGVPYLTTGPYGDQITAQPVTFNGVTPWRMTPSGGINLTGSGTAVRCSVWARLRNTHTEPFDCNIKLTTRTPLVSTALKYLLMPGEWHRLNVDVTVTYTASTGYELELNAATVGKTPLIDVWMDSWTIEDFSTPWNGHHRLNLVGASAMTVADQPLPLFAIWGDSIAAGGGSAATGHYLSEVITGRYECTRDASSNGGAGGETSTQVRTRVLAASAAIKQRASVIWCGINDGLSVSPEQTVRNIVDMVDEFIAQGNTRYAVCTITHVQGHGPGSVLHARRTEANRLLKIHPKLRGRTIDVSAGLGDVPDSIYMGDVTHPNNKGYQDIIYPLIKAHIDQKGWFARRQVGDW